MSNGGQCELYELGRLMHVLFTELPDGIELRFSHRRAIAKAVIESDWLACRLDRASKIGWDQGHLGYDDGQANPYRQNA